MNNIHNGNSFQKKILWNIIIDTRKKYIHLFFSREEYIGTNKILSVIKYNTL